MKPHRTIARRTLMLGAIGAAAIAAAPARVLASSYPERSITFICPWPAGGTADRLMRVICQVAARELGQPIVLENRAGASGMIGTKALASARPDGYTIGQIPISVTRFAQLGSVQLDPLQDFTYLARSSGQTFGIAVTENSPYQTLADVVTAAKAEPGVVTYAHAGIGGATHVGMEEFAYNAGISFNPIAYKGGSAALQDVLGGQVELLADSSSWAPYVESGKMRLLATWGESRTPRFKDVSTLKELGYDMVVEAPNGIGGPKGLPAEVQQRLREAFRTAIHSDEFRQAAESIDSPIMYLDAGDYQQYIQVVYQQETELIRKLNLKELMAKG